MAEKKNAAVEAVEEAKEAVRDIGLVGNDPLMYPVVFSLIGKAMREIGAIGKDQEAKNYSGKKMYNFRGIDDVYNAVNPVFAKHGLFIIPEIIEKVREERERVNDNGQKIGVLIYSILTVRFSIYGPDGSCVTGTTVGEAMDSGDKSVNKAMSAALKYFLFQTLLIPTEELKDPDGDVYNVAPKNEYRPKSVSTPANVTTAPALPEANNRTPPADPEPPKVKVNEDVLKLIANEQAFMAKRLEKTALETKVWFAEHRKMLIESGAVPNIQISEMTIDDAKNLCEAIYSTFMSDSPLSGDVQ